MKAVRIVAILALLGVLSGGFLAAMSGAMTPLIEENRRLATQAAVKEVLPGTDKVRRVEEKGAVMYSGFDSDGRPIGHAFEVEWSGFQGPIKMMVGLDPEFKELRGLYVIESLETPGLGSKITETPFRSQFVGLDGEREILLVKNQRAVAEKNQVESITGATISAQAVVDGLNTEIAVMRETLFREAGR
jgi:Na+-translocating ferredoxin:NAD+ oxidoreductase subunit G